MRWARHLAIFLGIVVWIVLSPLRAMAATSPTIIAYDVAVRSTATTTLGKRDAAQSEIERARTVCDDSTFPYDASSNRPTAAGVRGILPYDDALNFGERHEVGEGVIYVATAVTAAAEGVEPELVNLASAQRTAHITVGDATGGGHMWPGAPDKTPFSQRWSADQMMQHVSDMPDRGAAKSPS